jgi:hypothetical protein
MSQLRGADPRQAHHCLSNFNRFGAYTFGTQSAYTLIMRNLNTEQLQTVTQQLNSAQSVWRDATSGRFTRQPYTAAELAWFRAVKL